MVNLLKDKPYMNASAPRPPVEDTDDLLDDSDREDTGQVQLPTPDQPEQLHPNISRDTTYLGASSWSQTLIHPRTEAASKLYRGVV